MHTKHKVAFFRACRKLAIHSATLATCSQRLEISDWITDVNLQKRYDLQRAERELGAKINAIPTLEVA
jgi:hypothetical protein